MELRIAGPLCRPAAGKGANLVTRSRDVNAVRNEKGSGLVWPEPWVPKIWLPAGVDLTKKDNEREWLP